jgi:hypothetical protein
MPKVSTAPGTYYFSSEHIVRAVFKFLYCHGCNRIIKTGPAAGIKFSIPCKQLIITGGTTINTLLLII